MIIRTALASRFRTVVGCAALITSGICTGSPPAAAGTPTPDVVSQWNAVSETIIAAKNASPGIHFALVHLAIFDAVNSIERRYRPYLGMIDGADARASADAAAAAAAHEMLSLLFADQAAIIDPPYASSLAAIPDGEAETRGVQIGRAAALRLFNARRNDGRYAPGSYTFQSGPGAYQTTPPAFLSPILTAQGAVQPFAIPYGAAFRAYGPPDLTSAAYAREFAEVKRLGRADSTERTAEQTAIARFYFEGPATFWTRNYRTLISRQRLSTVQRARLYALLLTSYADASIACWDSKYYYNFWRPITAIHNADSDGNAATGADPTWTPLAFTPPHPEYPSAHACITSAMNEALRQFYGTYRVPMTLTSLVPGAAPRRFENLRQQTHDIIDARVWAGLHFRSANVAGAELGREVGNYIGKQYFRPLTKKDMD